MNRIEAFKILEIQSNANQEQIKTAYRKMASKWHPDKFTELDQKKKAEEKFKSIKEAYELLTQPVVKNTSHNFSNFGDLFRQYAFGNFEDFKFQDLKPTYRFTVPITLEEAFTGCVKNYSLQLDKEEVKTFHIRAGMSNGEPIETFNSYKDGQEIFCEVFVEIRTEYQVNYGVDNGNYPRKNDGDIRKPIKISALKLITGGWEEYTTIDNSVTQIRIPAGLEAGKMLKVKNRGYWKNSESKDRGDVYLMVIPEIKKLEEYDSNIVIKFLKSSIEILKHLPIEQYEKILSDIFDIKFNDK